MYKLWVLLVFVFETKNLLLFQNAKQNIFPKNQKLSLYLYSKSDYPLEELK